MRPGGVHHVEEEHDDAKQDGDRDVEDAPDQDERNGREHAPGHGQAPAIGGTGTEARIDATAASAVAPCRPRSRLTIMRCGSTAGATALTSSGVTKARPEMTAAAWATR